LRRSARLHPVLATLSGIALVVCVLFVLRLGVLIWTGGMGASSARLIEGWMTPGYLVRVYDLDQAALADVFGVEPGRLHRRPLSQIATDLGVPLADLIAALDAQRAP
jgi:hypothetical protein